MSALDRKRPGADHLARRIVEFRALRRAVQLTVTSNDSTLLTSGDLMSGYGQLVGNSARPERFDHPGPHRLGNSRVTGRICADSHLVEPVPGCTEVNPPPG